MGEHRRARPKTAAVALLGFSLATLRGGSARASGPTNLSTDCEGVTSGTTSATGITLTAVGGVMAVAGGVLLVIMLVNTPKLDADRVANSRSRLLLDVGALTARGDLGPELVLLIQSPNAYDQLADELDRGSGPALDAMVNATSLAPAELAEHWRAAAQRGGLITDQEGAARFAMDFVAQLAPRLSVRESDKGLLLWQLQRERLASGLSERGLSADAPAHDWLARWLGVPRSAVDAATTAALRDLDGHSEAEMRARLTAEADQILDALSGHIYTHHPEQVESRIAEIVARAAPWAPPDAMSGLASL